MVKRAHFECGESAVTVIADERHHPVIRHAVMEARACIQQQIDQDPFFAVTLEPSPPPGKEEVVDRMCRASQLTGVGPMAAVAGAVAEQAVMAAMKDGADFVVVDNGGDIALHTDREVTIGLYGIDPALHSLGMLIPPIEGILGVCSSSARIGHSISFGTADICTVLAEDVTLADATATHLGNLIVDASTHIMDSSLRAVMDIPGVKAALASAEGRIAMKGDMPRLLRVRPSESLITKRVHLR
jgi:ApbE superfamily uncharacterized protein (UPF0280 family)